MEKEKAICMLDYANIQRAARGKRYRLDYHDLLCYIGEGRFLMDAHCFVPINPRNEHRLDREIEDLWRAGYMVHSKVGSIAGGSYRCTFAVEMTMDIMKTVYQAKPDIIVLVSGDADFVPLVQEVRASGVRVEVAAFEESAGIDLLLKSSGFINLAVYYEGYLAAQRGEGQAEPIEDRYQKLIRSQEHDPDEEHDLHDLEEELEEVEKLTALEKQDRADGQTSDSADMGNAEDTIDELNV